MARKKEKRFYPIDELFNACESVYHFIIEDRISRGKTQALQKRRKKNENKI